MPEIAKQTGEGFQTTVDYFGGQYRKNVVDQDPGDEGPRKAALPDHLRALVKELQKKKFDFEKTDIKVAKEGYPFKVSTDREGPMATWAVRVRHSESDPPVTIFCDAETEAIGKHWSNGWSSIWEYPADDESYALCIAENGIAEELQRLGMLHETGIEDNTVVDTAGGLALAQAAVVVPAVEAV